MKIALYKLNRVYVLLLFCVSLNATGQVLEWQLTNPVYNSADPDGAGPAVGSITFTLQIRTKTGAIPNVTGISTGWSWQSSKSILPTTGTTIPTCGTNSVNPPGNVVMSPAFAAQGFTYNNVNQCSGSVNFLIGNETFDRRSSGIIDGGSITLTTAWTDVFTVTLWAKNTANPKGGYVVINSGAGGSPFAFPVYAVADVNANEFVVNSLTYTIPLPLASPVLPVLLTKFEAQCLPDKSVGISWTTAAEINNKYFEVEKSLDGTTWTTLNKINVSGNSSVQKNYQIKDQQGGTALYRLKQIDIDGKITYSNIVKTACAEKSMYVALYPVPARDIISLVIGADRRAKTNLQVFDIEGRLVMNMPVTLAIGRNNFTIPVNNLPAGEYLLRGTDRTVEINKRFTIIK